MISPGDFAGALEGLVDRPFLASVKYGEQQMRARRVWDNGGLRADGTWAPGSFAHPSIVRFSDAVVRSAAKLGIPLFASEIIRSPERQKELFVKGFSKTPDDSSHLVGLAVDIVHSVKGWDLDPMQWLLIAHIAKDWAIRNAVHISWGGDWSVSSSGVGWDPAHWEISYWRSVAKDFPFPSGYDPATGRPSRRVK